MADIRALTQNPRRRNLLVLAVLAAVLAVLAVLALLHQSREVTPHYERRSFLPGLAWLVRSVFTPKTTAIDWLDKQVIDVDTSKIQEADINPLNGPSYELRRDKPSDPDLKLVNLPQGREIAYPGAADGIAGSISNFTFDDVKPARGFDFSDGHAARLVARTFDGLIVTLQALKQGPDFWATISADAAPGKAGAQRQARAIDSRTSGWAYKLPPYKGQQIMTTLDSLLKPLPEKS